MQKPAQTDYPIHELIRERWSPRAFAADKPVTAETLGSLMEAARWAPSCFNEQPWRFIVETKDNPEGFEKLLKCLVAFNQSWASGAHVLMVSVAAERFAKNDKENAHARHDVGLATENLVLQAQALGLVSHQMAGFDGDAVREAYGVPEGYTPVTAIAIGHQGDPDDLDEKLAERERAPRTRKNLDELFFSGAWSQPTRLG